jgi:hypothetical protein
MRVAATAPLRLSEPDDPMDTSRSSTGHDLREPLREDRRTRSMEFVGSASRSGLNGAVDARQSPAGSAQADVYSDRVRPAGFRLVA